MDQDIVERLELKLAFLERANAELSDVVYRQHKELEGLREGLRALAEKLDARQSAEVTRRPEDERPPHY
ncbi:MAG TPA: SlyX family protein [Steroidobacteraceae bacterium]|nr:SlyX family protein [Steroidobacteraceae bacterium]